MSRPRNPERALSAGLGVDVVLAGDLAACARRAGLARPAPFRPPHPHLSLTHAGDVVVAAAVGPADRYRVRGLGIDYEPAARDVTARAGRLFLDDDEVAAIDARPEDERSAARLVLWTVKEAAYKATPDNGRHTVAAYHVRDGVTHFRDELMFRHATVPFAGGHLAAAVLVDEFEAMLATPDGAPTPSSSPSSSSPSRGAVPYPTGAVRQRNVALLPQVRWEVGDGAG